MKIAITTYSLSYGGVGNFILDLAQFLMKNSHELEIICTDSPGAWFPRIEEIGAKSKKFTFGIWGWIPFGRFIHTSIIGRYIKNQEFDLIINNHSYFIHASDNYFRPKTKLIAVIHNQLPHMVEAECSSIPDVVVCVSNKIYQQAIQYTKGNKILSILNGAKFPLHFKREYSENTMGKTNILFVGRLDDRQKAVFMLPGIIEGLMERGNDIHLSIIGTGPDSKKLEVIIKNKNLKATISMVGLIDADKVSEYYQSHQIFVLPSNFEGLPLTLVEAMGNGCVPVVSNLPDSTDICVKDGINGFLVNIGDQNGFIDKIEVLIKNPRLLKKMSKECIELANNKFSLEQAHSCYLKVINELLSEKNQTRNIQIKQNRLLFKDWKEIIPFHLIMILKKGLHKIWK